jgi:protease-4
LISFCLLVAILIGVGFVIGMFFRGVATGSLPEQHFAGKSTSQNKIAIIRLEGLLVEGRTSYFEKQIDQAAKDDAVKAVVVRIDSPGGSITASEDLYRRLVKLRDGDKDLNTKGKPLVVSMGATAASGGYYIAMPAKNNIMAESTTITGSIGVYAALPNVHEAMEKIHVQMNVIKAGDQKDGGSPFAALSPKDEQILQNMVDHAYLRFIEVVEDGRPDLKGKLQETITIKETLAVRKGSESEQKFDMERYRADGGIFTADQAKEYGLIDDIGTKDDAVKRAAKLGNVSEYNVVQYERPPSLLGALFGIKAPQAPLQLDADRLADAATMRLWYLAPQSEIAGLLAVAGKE